MTLSTRHVTADAIRSELAWLDAAQRLDFEPPDPAIARRHLLESIRLHHPRYLVGWFHRELCRELERFSAGVAAGEGPRLMIAAPPRSGKSEIVSRQWPVWHLGQHPHHEVVVSSYGQDLANDMSRDARAIRAEGTALWPTLAPSEAGKDGVELWQIAGGGSYKAVGAGGPLTGRGAHALVIDDPLKNAEEAESETIRESRWSWYRTTAYTRLAPGGGILVMATRWHADDLSGRLLREAEAGGDQWRVVSFPAIAEEDEPYRRAGEALCPERYPLPELERIRRAIGARAWASLYQQRPSPPEGALFRREWMGQRYRFDPQRPVDETGRNPMRWDELIVSVDATFKAGKTSDYVSMGAWARKGARAYRLDELRARMSFVDTRHALRGFVAKWGPSAVLIEDAANGPALISDLKSEIPGIVPFEPRKYGKKEQRAEVAARRFEAGDVWLPADAPWVGDYIEELCSFPHGAYDDRVDDTSQVLIWWAARASGDTARLTGALRSAFDRLGV